MRTARLLAYGLPALFAVVLFGRVLGGGFVYDDRVLIESNPRMHEPGVVLDAFQQPYWELVSSQRTAAGYYRPLGATAFALTWQLAGDDPQAFHLLSLLLHAGCAMAVAALALALGWTPLAAGAAGTLFAVHGAHVEAVAWISAVPELLATLFSLLGLRALVRDRTLACAAWLACAMLSKEAAIGVWLLAAGAVLLRPGERPRLPRLGALLGAAALVYLLRAQAFGDGGWNWLAGFDRVTTHHGLPLDEQAGLSLSLLGRYLGYLVWPWPHAPFQPLRLDLSWSDPERLLPAAAGLAAAAAAGALWLWRGRRSPLILIALGLTFAGLVPVMNTRGLGQFPFEERFLYLPSAGFALLLAGLLMRLRPRVLGAAAIALAGTAHAVSAWPVVPKWQDEETLFSWARKVSPDAMTPHLEYGRLMLERALAADARQDAQGRELYVDAALAAFQRALDVDPDEVLVTAVERERANVYQGDALLVNGEWRSAREVYRRVRKHYRESPLASLGLGNCAVQEGEELAKKGDVDAAVQAWRRALDHFLEAQSLHPELPSVWFGLAQAYGYLGTHTGDRDLLEDALRWAERSFAHDPASLDAASTLSTIHYALGNAASARTALERFVEAAPGHPQRAMVEETLRQLR